MHLTNKDSEHLRTRITDIKEYDFLFSEQLPSNPNIFTEHQLDTKTERTDNICAPFRAFSGRIFGLFIDLV